MGLFAVDSYLDGAVFDFVRLDIGHKIVLGIRKLTGAVIGFEISTDTIPSIKVSHRAVWTFKAEEVGIFGACLGTGTTIATTGASSSSVRVE